MHGRYIIETYMDEMYKHTFRMCAMWEAQAFSLMNYCGFDIEPFCSGVYGDYRRPQTLAEICRIMGIYCDFRAVAARGKYPGFMLLKPVSRSNPVFRLNPVVRYLIHCTHWLLWIFIQVKVGLLKNETECTCQGPGYIGANRYYQWGLIARL